MDKMPKQAGPILYIAVGIISILFIFWLGNI